MKSTFSRLTAVGLTMWLCFAAGAANAAGVLTISGFDGSASAGYNAIFGNNGVASSFTDWITFSIPADASGNGDANVISLTSKKVLNVKFTSFTLYESLSNVLSIGDIGASGTDASLTFSGGQVPGNYTLTLIGYKVNSALSGSYSGNIAIDPVSAVPEPETYAMMLAGLGLLGFSARRRNNNV